MSDTKADESAKTTGFKGFDKDLKCSPNGYTQAYSVGATVEHKGEIKLCAEGLHFVEYPLDALGYYEPGLGSRYCEVEADGVSPEKSGDSKRVCRRLFIKAELTIKGLVEAAIKFTFDRADWSKKETQATGVRGAASATGYRGAASATGDQGAASATGDQGAAISLGIEAKARGVKGAWLTIAEWKDTNDGWERVDVQTKRVDGKRIKADTFYQLKRGKFVEVS